jgi:serine protease Do
LQPTISPHPFPLPSGEREEDEKRRSNTMERKNHFRKIIIALLMVGALVGFGYGVSTAVKHSDTVASTGAAISETPMVPANFSDLAEKVHPGVVNIQVVNMRGEVIGINTAIIPSGRGIGFAIPVDTAKEIVPQLQEKGHVTRGWLGVNIQEITPALAKSFDLKESKGALVSRVLLGSPADKAGIEQGDAIVGFDGKEVNDPRDLSRMVASTPVGKVITVKLLRNGKAFDRQVKIGELEEKVEVTKAPSQKSLGITVQNLTPEIAKGMEMKERDGSGGDPGGTGKCSRRSRSSDRGCDPRGQPKTHQRCGGFRSEG